MQPEPLEVLTTSSTEETSPSSATTTDQHGHDDIEHGTASHGTPIGESGDAAAVHEGHVETDTTALSGESGGATESDTGGLKDGYDEQLDDKILEPNASNSGSPTRGRTSKPPVRTSPIANLPNELLTYALSHLEPSDLTSAALVSKRFHVLITTPHAWREAFARYFPGPATIAPVNKTTLAKPEVFRSDKRAFSRLTALSTWRSEYIIRTRLLRSLARGKPNLSGSGNNPRGFSGSGSAVMMYQSQLWTTANHIDAAFGSGLSKNFPRFIHGADEFGQATISDPTTGKIDNWGLADIQGFRSFPDIYGGTAMYGLGPGEIIGLRNVMDVSQSYGMVHGEGLPNGGVYYRSTDEGRGRFLLAPLGLEEPELGIPLVDHAIEAVSAVWIAKSAAIPGLTDGLVGILAGTSSGIVSAYSLGSQDLRDLQLGRGEVTARWVLSPGVPIIAIAVDDSYSLKRQAQNRIWAVVMNALGELFYLTKFPKRQPLPRGTKLDAPVTERTAWETGRSVYWSLVESSRRVGRPDPFGELEIDGSYSPRSSWKGMCLGVDQIKAESREIEGYMRKLPKDFRKMCHGWDMRRRLEADFAGDDGNLAGESFTVFDCGLDEGSIAAVKRFTRLKVPEAEETPTMDGKIFMPEDNDKTPVIERDSIFGPAASMPSHTIHSTTDYRGRGFKSMALNSVEVSPERAPTVEEWRCSNFVFNAMKSLEITTTTIDNSTFATLTLSEDPAVGMLGSSEASSSLGSPLRGDDRPITPSDIPGQRARFIAAGTKTGVVYVWDCRAATSKAADTINTIDPICIIYTESPEISCLAMTALQIVVGGNDGLVQAWDPLASSSEPIRTLNSRFSSRARRRLAQAQASPAGVGINLFAAGAICLDPDSSVLRGLVSLGTHLRYWSYSSLSADQFKGGKRRPRRSERGSNQHGGDFSGMRNVNLKSYIANERHDLEQDREQHRREHQRLKGRFGIGMLEDDEQALAYAALLSEESLAQDVERRASQVATLAMPSNQFTTPTQEMDEQQLDADMAAAIRLSLGGDSASPSDGWSPAYSYSPISGQYEIPMRIGRKGRRSSKTTSTKTSPRRDVGGASNEQEMDDLDFALQLSLAEEQSRAAADAAQGDEFPVLSETLTGQGKGKGKAKE